LIRCAPWPRCARSAAPGFTVLAERGRKLFDGIDLADSIALDPHKWLYQPYECGCLLVRNDHRLRSAFEITPEYLKDSAAAEAAEVNFADRGLQLTRTSRALKLWISLRYFGLAAFRAAIERSLELADLAARRVEASESLELVAPPSLGIVCFRRRFDGIDDEAELALRNAALVDALERSGIGLVSSTRLRGRYAIRLCPLNHSSTAADVERVLAFLESDDPARHAPRAMLERDRDPGRGWLRRAEVEPGSLAGLPVFASLSAGERRRAAELAGLREVAPGERIVEQWSVARDFYVVLEGAVEVLIDGEHVRHLGPGDFFGELAALDWEAGFAYPRLASVVATTAARLVVFPDAALNELMREFPAVATVIRTAAEARVQRH
jgi:aromatic-L-amino-acid/L-tryptophan decarboxylase